MNRTHISFLLSLVALVLALALPAVAPAGWTWDGSDATQPAPDGWTWDENAPPSPQPDGWTWDEASAQSTG